MSIQLRPFFLALAVIGSLPCQAEIRLHVSTNGVDTNAGTQPSPLASLNGARDRIRQLKQSSEYTGESIVVEVHSGTYYLSEPIALTEEDSGTQDAPIVYTAKDGHEVVISGGHPLVDWQPVAGSPYASRFPSSAQPFVKFAELPQGLVRSIGNLQPRSRHQEKSPATWELVVDGERMRLAGWPNQGWAKIGDLHPDGQSWITPEPVHVAPFHTTQAWAHGFWLNDWEDSYVGVKLNRSRSVDGNVQSRIEFAEPTAGKIRVGARYRIENLSSQLDAPGEWLADPTTGKVFLWPPLEDGFDGATLANLQTPLSLYDTSHVQIRNLTIEASRVCGIEIAGGESVAVENCTIRHVGNLGINLYHGRHHVIRDCRIYDTGAGAIRVEGGDRLTLEPCDHAIENNILSDFSRAYMAYRPAVNVYGVGVRVNRNLIHDGPHAAIILHGNEHSVEGNEIHSVCKETDDVGAIYLAHDPTFRGNVIRKNYLHDLGGDNRTGVIGVYLDDFASGTTVTENIFQRTVRGVAIGGGRDNTISNNLFIDCLAAIQIDNRGQTWAKSYVSGSDSKYLEYCKAIGFDQDLYARRYPELARVFDDQPEIAKGNRILRNLIDCPIGVDLHDGLDEKIVQLDANLTNARKLFVDVDHHDFRFTGDSPLEAQGFVPLSVSEVGPSNETGRFITTHP